MRIELSGGALALQFPDTLTTYDVDDIEAVFGIMMRVMRRMANKSPQHASDCAVHNAPALPVGECDCK